MPGSPVLPCADGGVCAFGDTGPGGGIVFYVHAGVNPFDCGPSLDLKCRYLEAWTADATTSADAATMRWSGGNSDDALATNHSIGAGYQNTLAAVAHSPTADTAVTVARESRGGLNDWYLPSRAELNELCKYARGQTTGNTVSICNNTGALRVGFASWVYWSSSDSSGANAWRQNFITGDDTVDTSKATAFHVRPVRAF